MKNRFFRRASALFLAFLCFLGLSTGCTPSKDNSFEPDSTSKQTTAQTPDITVSSLSPAAETTTAVESPSAKETDTNPSAPSAVYPVETTPIEPGLITPEEPVLLVPMDNVPDSFFQVDRSLLTPVPSSNTKSSETTYKDADGTRYLFDRNTGVYRGFIPPPTHTGFGAAADSIPMGRLESAADALAAHFISVSGYTRTYFYQEDTAVHKFAYHKCIQGYPSEDMGRVWITSDGNVELVIFANTGAFDFLTLPTMDEATLDTVFRQSLDEDRTLKQVYERLLTLRDGKPYIRYDYSYFIRSSNETDGLWSERDYAYIPVT